AVAAELNAVRGEKDAHLHAGGQGNVGNGEAHGCFVVVAIVGHENDHLFDLCLCHRESLLLRVSGATTASLPLLDKPGLEEYCQQYTHTISPNSYPELTAVEEGWTERWGTRREGRSCGTMRGKAAGRWGDLCLDTSRAQRREDGGRLRLQSCGLCCSGGVSASLQGLRLSE